MLRTVAGRPGWRRLLVSYLLAASLRCEASSVVGVTGKTPVQRRRGMNHVSAVNQAPVGWLVPHPQRVPAQNRVLVPEHQQLGVLRLMRGYLNNPEATAAVIDREGWLRTGDLGIADEDGWLTIADRVKELIKYKGLQVAPAELEAILMTHPQVADCAVIGVPDEEAGEVPKAFVVPAGDDFDGKAVLAFVAGQVAPYKRIRLIECLPEIPKSPSGKVLRRLLRPPARVS